MTAGFIVVCVLKVSYFKSFQVSTDYSGRCSISLTNSNHMNMNSLTTLEWSQLHCTQGGCPHRGRHDIYGSEEMSEIEVTSLDNLMLLFQ